MTRRASIAEEVLAAAADDNDYDVAVSSEEQPLLQHETNWNAPKGFIWIEIGMF